MSSDDDFGFHTLYYKRDFLRRFKVNLFRSTKFVCDATWQDPNEKNNHEARFNAYQAKRDRKKHCKNDCKWNIARDGGYLRGGVDQFPEEQMFSFVTKVSSLSFSFLSQKKTKKPLSCPAPIWSLWTISEKEFFLFFKVFGSM